MSGREEQINVNLKPLMGAVEALLLSSELPLSPQQIHASLDFGTVELYQQAVDELNREYRQTGRSFEIQKVAGGYQIYTLPQYSKMIERLWIARKRSGLTRSALETLAIIAYRQPITRLMIEEIRGVNSESVLQGLLERGLIKIGGRQSSPGRPLLYYTTNEFLRYFGLDTLADLPKDKDFPSAEAAQSNLFEIVTAPETTKNK
jgi:segregation and condensation protein B